MENTVGEKTRSWLDRPVASFLPRLNIETLLVSLILILALISRFSALGVRVMSHDETNHVVPAYELYQGNGYVHDPITHGPLQFHLLAASYFLFGDTDFSSRIPAALFSVITIAFVLLAFKRYLGRTGALLAGVFFLISPYMLFYGRYTRNEAFVGLFGVVMLYAVLRYLETGKKQVLFLFTAALALHFASKETAYIYTAQLLIFLAVLFLLDVIRMAWTSARRKRLFLIEMLEGLFFTGLALGAGVLGAGVTEEAAASVGGISPEVLKIVLIACIALALISFILGIYVLIKDLGWKSVKDTRSFDLLLLTITLVLPLLIAVPMKVAGWDPLDYSQAGILHTAITLAIVVSITVVLGLLWKPKTWLGNMAVFYSIFTVFYTTFFTNGQGFFTGLVGSLGYWMSQQGVNRGSQPWFYFPFLQVPMYEYLPALGTILAAVIGIRHKLFSTLPGIAPAAQTKIIDTPIQLPLPETEAITEENGFPEPRRLPVLSLLLYWSVMSLLAYSIAGEKMPWLTVHISLPMCLAAGFGIGYLLDTLPFKRLASAKGILTWLLISVFLVSLGETLNILTGPNRPFAGKELAQLQTTSTFLFAFLATLLSAWGLWRLLREWSSKDFFRLSVATLMAILAVFTARSAYQASYINYDNGKEFLVYAHSAQGPKDVLEQVEDISLRTTGGKNIQVAYIGDALYPYWWYFRDYPNKTWLKDQMTRDLLNYPIVISDDEQYSKTLAILKDGYTDTKYTRLVWPMQDYFNLSWKGLWEGIKNPAMRQAIFKIWFNKDYSQYAALANNSGLTLETWQPSAGIHLFIKKDIVAQIWSYGTLPSQTITESIDPYAGKYVSLIPESYFGAPGSGDGQLSIPRGIAIAPDGSVYVADSRNNRIQKFTSDGKFLLSWGSYGSVDAGSAPGSTFNEPWGVAVAPDGSVYVADTWNYRIQKFSPDGKFISMWGDPGPADSPTTYWGPRGVATDQNGWVYVADTGNNRVVVFNDRGEFQTQFGYNGVNEGEFDEPVGIAVDDDGLIYVADTWNQRIQVFEPADGGGYQVVRSWQVEAWFGRSVNSDPFLALDHAGNVFITDPDAFRVLQFTTTGDFVRGWGDPSAGIDGFGAPSGITVDSTGAIWVTDAGNNYVLKFVIPTIEASSPADLPAIPQGLTYYSEDRVLVDETDKFIYQLSEDGLQWIPYVNENLQAQIGGQVTPTRDFDDKWVLQDTDGVVLFTWDEQNWEWVAAQPTP